MIEFLKFWGRCAADGWEIGDGIINFIGTIALLVSAFLLLRKRHKARKQWEELAMKITFWIFATTFVLSTVFIAPFLQYEDARNKLESTKIGNFIQWQPPRTIAGTKDFLFLIGGNVDSRMQIRGTPGTLDIQQIKTNNGVLIPGQFSFPAGTAKFFDDTIYLNVDIPTKTKPIEINEGKSGPLPDGWDWNCNSNILEIVDEQNQAVFQEIYISPNFIWVRGALQFGGTFFIAGDNSMPPSPHGYFNVADIGLQTIFAYPSSENRGVKILK